MNQTERDLMEHEARAILRKVRAFDDGVTHARNNELVGNCYRYRNNYSMPSKPSDYWYLYARITSNSPTKGLRCFDFQTDMYGELTINADRHFTGLSNFQPIKPSEFARQWKKVQARIARLSPHKD